MQNSVFALFLVVMSGVVIFTILLLISSYYSMVKVGDEIEFELNGVKDFGVVDSIEGDIIYVITESNPDKYTVITYENVL